MHKAVLHVTQRVGYDYSTVFPAEKLPELKQTFKLAYEYTETLGDTIYDHYNVIARA